MNHSKWDAHPKTLDTSSHPNPFPLLRLGLNIPHGLPRDFQAFETTFNGCSILRGRHNFAKNQGQGNQDIGCFLPRFLRLFFDIFWGAIYGGNPTISHFFLGWFGQIHTWSLGMVYAWVDGINGDMHGYGGYNAGILMEMFMEFTNDGRWEFPNRPLLRILTFTICSRVTIAVTVIMVL